MKIGFMDSGIGGLSLLHTALKKISGQQFLYYSDSANVPYGEKTAQEILTYTDMAVRFMLGQGCRAIVIACNTATSVAAAALRETYDIAIIGMEPAVKKALDSCEGRVLAAATPITVRGDKLHHLLDRVDKHFRVDLLPLPGLVRFAESGTFDADVIIPYLQTELDRFELTQYSALVLGCTHFNFFKDSFRAVLPDQVRLIDGNDGTVNQLIRLFPQLASDGVGSTSVEFYDSAYGWAGEAEKEHISALLARLDKMYEIS